jgi:predicted metal-dependent hydrolase
MTPSPAREQIEIGWGERRAVAELRRTARRVLRIDVEPTGQVVVFAPSEEKIETIQTRVKAKAAWIFREIDLIEHRPAVTPARHFISGETHLLLGKQYRLTVQEGNKPVVRVEGARIYVITHRADDPTECMRVLMAFYAFTARRVFRERLDAMAPPFLRKGMELPLLIIRPMAKRWGSFTPSGRVVLNVDLVRASTSMIDYVICHELAHAFHADHGKEWRDLLSTVMPDWESRKAQLEAFLR